MLLTTLTVAVVLDTAMLSGVLVSASVNGEVIVAVKL
jgi:hypothetical protein